MGRTGFVRELGQLRHSNRLRADQARPRLIRRASFAFLVTVWLVAGSSAAHAVPVEFNIQAGGTATATAARFGGPTIGNFTFASVSGTVTLDSVTHELLDLDVTLGSSNLEILSSSYGGYDEVQVVSVNLGKGTPFSTSTPTEAPPGTFTMSSGEIAVASVFSATDSLGVNSPLLNTPLNFDAPLMTVVVAPNGATAITFVGIPVVVLEPSRISLPVFEPSTLLVVGNLGFDALASGGGSPIPEPSGLLLMVLGLGITGGLAWKGRTQN